MGAPLKVPDFFVLEAGEALDGLEQALAATPTPPADDLVRATRLLRGAALMARQQPIARAAAALETVTRHYREQPSVWSEAVRERLRHATADFRMLVARVHEWSEADTARALRLGRDLERLAGGEQGSDVVAAIQGSESGFGDGDDNRDSGDAAGGKDRDGGGDGDGSGTLETGVRAFVARESALVASALDRTARTLRAGASDREPLYTVVRRMQSLRGLAELSELAPLPEILDGIELAVSDLTRTFAPPPDAHRVIEAAALALTRLAREVADTGRPTPETEEIRRFTDLLIHIFAVDDDIVPITALLDESDTAPVQPSRTATGFRPSDPLTPVALVSYGEHLCRAADLLAGAHSTAARDLRLYQLLGTLRTVDPADPNPVAAALGIFARAVRGMLAAGTADDAMPLLLEGLRAAGTLLRSIAESDDPMQISRRVLDAAHRMARDAGHGVEREAAHRSERNAAHGAERDAADRMARDATRGVEREAAHRSERNAAHGAERDATDRPEPPRAGPSGAVSASRHPNAGLDSDVIPIEQLLAEPADGGESPVVPIEQLLVAEATDGDEPPVVSIEQLLVTEAEDLDESPVVPIEQLVAAEPADGEESPIVPIEQLAPDSSTAAAERPSAMEMSFRTYHALARQRHDELPSLATFFRTSGSEEPIAIEALCYRGPAALERATVIRSHLRTALADRDVSLPVIQPLLDELLDLIPLAAAP